MNMKKIFATLAATTISVASFAAMSLSSASAADAVGIAKLAGQAGSYTYWGEGANGNTANITASNATIDGNAQYQVSWELEGDGTGSIEFLILELTGADPENEELKNFTADQYPDLNVTVDELWIDGAKVDYATSDAAKNLKYYENTGRSRIYFVDTWGNVANDISKDTAITSEVKVLFTVSGLYNDGTSNVTEAPTEAPTTTVAGTTTPTSTTTTVAGATGTTTTVAGATTTKAGATTTKAPTNGGSTESSTNTGDAGVGIAIATLTLAGTAAFVARKKD